MRKTRRHLALVLVLVPFVPLAVIACKKPDQATPEGATASAEDAAWAARAA